MSRAAILRSTLLPPSTVQPVQRHAAEIEQDVEQDEDGAGQDRQQSEDELQVSAEHSSLGQQSQQSQQQQSNRAAYEETRNPALDEEQVGGQQRVPGHEMETTFRSGSCQPEVNYVDPDVRARRPAMHLQRLRPTREPLNTVQALRAS